MKIIDKIKNAENACLILQGGGMRGAYTAGVLREFQQLGLNEHFRHIVGESAGALNGAYFLTRQFTEDGAHKILQDHMATTQFIDLKKFPTMIDINFLNHIVRHVMPLSTEEAKELPTELHVGVTNAQTMEPWVFSSKGDHLVDALIASASVPIFSDVHSTVDGLQYVDGGLSHTVPYEYAKTLACDLFVIVLTNPVDHKYYKNKLRNWFGDSAFMPSKYSRGAIEAIKHMDTAYNDTLSKIKTDAHNFNDVEALFPSDPSRLVGMLDTDPDSVAQTVELGSEDASAFLYTEAHRKPHDKIASRFVI